MSYLLLTTGNVSDSGFCLLLGLVLLCFLSSEREGRKEGNVFSLNISSFHVEPERRGNVCRHIYMGFDKPAQMGRGPRLPSGARVK